MKEKKILFLIYTSKYSSGGGGHFYSLKSISKSLDSKLNYQIINLGYAKTKVFKDTEKFQFFLLKKWDIIYRFFSLLKIVRNINPDVIHAFDSKSLFVARSLSFFLNINIVSTKCGGPNGNSKYISTADSFILFSKENFEFYSKFTNDRIPKFLLPNRIEEVKVDNSHIQNFKKKYNINDELLVLRISRFNPYYNLTFIQTINLFKQIHYKNKNSRLLFIGTIQSQEYYENLKLLILKENLPIDLITIEEFTHNAKKLLPIADIVIATGRGVMEAASLNKIIFCPVTNSKFPVALNKNTFNLLFSMNFSERSIVNEISSIDFERIIKKKENQYTRYFFDKYFNVNNVSNKYLAIYSNVKKHRQNPLNYLINLIRFLK
ncbi:hypothetical protein [Croceibacter atlanticus]|uniref:hypothetical protein n=1 Tax=Croceibacter atlanticus TaxID=313588 RepID=UPI002E141CA7|nr:hypothetical protein VVL01_00290 [Croceibacter atlanticus]